MKEAITEWDLAQILVFIWVSLRTILSSNKLWEIKEGRLDMQTSVVTFQKSTKKNLMAS